MVNLGFNRAVQIAGGMIAHPEFKLNQPNLNYGAAKVTFGAASGCSKKSTRILMKPVAIGRKASSVGQIWSQMKKLVFLQKTSPR